ncbi:hypothetical protein WJX73_010754 [Symbiochloris irregularis]|uniref:Fungal lipase-type domain-containing protein n=1 Tax=Symbiochloris irregularis TaxID=706552 RepID=A0AAW1NP28_9CHLO
MRLHRSQEVIEPEPDDLLCDVSERRKQAPASAPQKIVVLQIEVASSTEVKVATGLVTLFVFLAFCALVVEIALKLHLKDSVSILKDPSLSEANVAIACVCLCVLGGQTANFLWRVKATLRSGIYWGSRRKRMASLAYATAIVQIVNLIFWLVPNVHVIKNFPCSFFDLIIDVSGVLRWSCWNTTLVVYAIMGSSLLSWKPGTSVWSRVFGRKSNAVASDRLLGLDRPWWHFLYWLPMWILLEIAVILLIENDFYEPGLLPIQLEICEATTSVTCGIPSFALGATIAMSVLINVQALLYGVCVARARSQLRKLSHATFRTANILLQLQLRTVLYLKVGISIATVLFWYIRHNSCVSYLLTWLGIIPIQLIASVLAWHNLRLFIPTDPTTDHILQVWLQEVAWTEAETPERLAERNSQAEGQHEGSCMQTVRQEPMFNFETALKLIKWCSLTYSTVGQDGCLKNQWVAEAAPEQHSAGLVRSSMHRPLEPPSEPSSSSISKLSLPAAIPIIHQDRADAMGMWALTDIHSFWDPELETKALLGWSRDQIVVAFRGTASFTNALLDLKIWRTPHHAARDYRELCIRGPALVHTGYYEAWMSKGLNQQVLNFLKELFQSGAVRPSARISLTGHSLGGALATLAALDIAVQIAPQSLQVYTFGCPYVGNHTFAHFYEARVRDTWHIIHNQDIVPRVGKFFFLFKRPGHRVLVDLKGQMIVRPVPLELQLRRGGNVGVHLLRMYRAALVAIFLAQFSNGRAGVMASALHIADNVTLRADLRRDGIDWQELQKLEQIARSRGGEDMLKEPATADELPPSNSVSLAQPDPK